jgi:hypothetical protein
MKMLMPERRRRRQTGVSRIQHKTTQVADPAPRKRSIDLKGTCHCGAIEWQLDGDPGSITACNCTVCRRYGALWAYDWEGERIRLSGPTAVYTRKERTDPFLEFHFCPSCACVVAWRTVRPDEDGRRRMAVNVRLAPPEAVADLLIDHFDGLDVNRRPKLTPDRRPILTPRGVEIRA